MIVDASALLAVVLGEDDSDTYSAALVASGRPMMSAINFLEAAVRIDRLGKPQLVRALQEALTIGRISVVAATPEHADIAREAYRRFGKGNHVAGLNLGDCFAYALAKATGEPLLFKGDDFARTDIAAAL